MADKKPAAAPAPATKPAAAPAPVKTPADLIKTGTQALTKEEEDIYSKFAGAGTENIAKDELRPPRLMLAQGGSPYIKMGNPKLIDGLKESEYFNDLSGENYKTGPIQVIVVKYLGARGAIFDKDGKIAEMNIALDDPRMQFTTSVGEGGKKIRNKPEATKFMDFIVWMIEQQELVSWSLKGTALGTGVKMLNLLRSPLKLDDGRVIARPPLWSRIVQLTSAMKQEGQFSWALPVWKQMGRTPAPLLSLGGKLYESFEGKEVVVPVEDLGGAEPEVSDPDAEGAEKEM